MCIFSTISFKAETQKSNPVVIGTGGSKTVWRIRDDISSSFKAIAKFHFPNPLDEEYRNCSESERNALLKEAEDSVLMRAAHEEVILVHLSECPNVVQLEKVLLEGSRPVFVMRYYAGGNLETALEKGTLSPNQKKEIALDLLKGLEACHAKQVFLADLKPSNVLLTANLNAALSDFGVSCKTDDEEQLKVDTYNLFANVFSALFTSKDGKAYTFTQSFLQKYNRDACISSTEALKQFQAAIL